jgi:ribosomal-protein-alanine N-acetyltransferase
MTLANLSPSAGHWSVEQYQRIFRDSIPRRIALVVEEGPVVQALLIAGILDAEREIENIVVAGPHRRRGIGKQLLEEFLRLSGEDGAKSIFLEVRESNLAARRLYEKQGFFENGRRQRYYGQPEEDAVLYRFLFK